MTEDEILNIVHDELNRARSFTAGDFKGEGPSSDRNLFMTVRWLDDNAPEVLEDIGVTDLNTSRAPMTGPVYAGVGQFRRNGDLLPMGYNASTGTTNPSFNFDEDYQANSEYNYASPQGTQAVQGIANATGGTEQDVLDHIVETLLQSSTRHETNHILDQILEHKGQVEQGGYGRYVDPSGQESLIPYNTHGNIRELQANSYMDMQGQGDPYDIIWRNREGRERSSSNREYLSANHRDRKQVMAAEEYLFQQYLEENDLTGVPLPPSVAGENTRLPK